MFDKANGDIEQKVKDITVVCAWCCETMTMGNVNSNEISHGICPDCRSDFMESLAHYPTPKQTE